MKAVVYFKNGKSETFNAKGLMFDDGSPVDIALTKKMIRPPDKHYIAEVSLNMGDIEKIEVLND